MSRDARGEAALSEQEFSRLSATEQQEYIYGNFLSLHEPDVQSLTLDKARAWLIIALNNGREVFSQRKLSKQEAIDLRAERRELKDKLQHAEEESAQLKVEKDKLQADLQNAQEENDRLNDAASAQGIRSLQKRYDELQAKAKKYQADVNREIKKKKFKHEKLDKRLGRIKKVKHALETTMGAMFTFIFGMFIRPTFSSLVLGTVAAPILFSIAAVGEVMEFFLLVSLTVVERRKEKLEQALDELKNKLKEDDQAASDEVDTVLVAPSSLKGNLKALAISFAKMSGVVTAVVGSIAFKSVFTTPILGLAGGLTPLIFTIVMGGMGALNLGKAVYYFVKSSKASDSDIKANYKQQAKQSLIGGLLFAVAAVGVAFIMLNPAVMPVVIALGATASTAYGAFTIYNNRQHIADFGQWVWRGVKSWFADSKKTEDTKPLLDNEQVYDDANLSRLSGGTDDAQQVEIIQVDRRDTLSIVSSSDDAQPISPPTPPASSAPPVSQNGSCLFATFSSEHMALSDGDTLSASTTA
jgi:Skp family chaperone for outer membrane proteins